MILASRHNANIFAIYASSCQSAKIRYLQEVGHLIRPPKSKQLIDGIYELRAQAEGDITRVLYFFVVGNKAVLTHSFIKKTEKTPPEEIAKAEGIRRRYMEQQKEATKDG